MNFSRVSMRGAEIWHIWKQHHLVECFWKILKSILHIRAMQLQGNGLYTALLIKVFAYLLALRLQAQRPFSKLSITQIMRKLSRDHDLKDMLTTHFHLPIWTLAKITHRRSLPYRCIGARSPWVPERRLGTLARRQEGEEETDESVSRRKRCSTGSMAPVSRAICKAPVSHSRACSA
jgi:hypothetical protein